MIGDNARGVIANVRKLNYPTRMLISLKAEKLRFDELPNENPDLVYTTGLYYLKFTRLTRNGELNFKKFMIRLDFGNEFIKCSNYDDLVNQTTYNDIAKFLVTYTNLCPQMFKIAVQNEGMQIPISFDVLKYDAELRTKWGVKNDEYAMIYNPYKPVKGFNWYNTEDDKIELLPIKEGRANEIK